MELFDVLRPECVSVGRSPQDKTSALREIAALAKASPLLEKLSEQEIFDHLVKREEMGSTGIGGGVAIPHCRFEEIQDFVVGLIAVPDGVDFDALDGEKVKFIAFIIGPENASNDHIRLLSAISEVISIPGTVDEMAQATSAEAMRESFLRHCSEEIHPDEEEGRQMFHIFVQDEDLFHDILRIIGAREMCSTVVLTPEHTRSYLAKIPLFADFWEHDSRVFSRLILATVNKRITNDIIRRIERITGPLKDQSNVMITVQDVFYASGTLAT